MLTKINHTQLSNDFVDNHMCRLNGGAVKVFIAVSRKTVGWHKDVDAISVSQIMKITGLSNRGVLRAIAELEKYGLVIVYRSKTQNNKNNTNFYTINYQETDGKQKTGSDKMSRGSDKMSPTGSDKMSQTKEREINSFKIKGGENSKKPITKTGKEFETLIEHIQKNIDTEMNPQNKKAAYREYCEIMKESGADLYFAGGALQVSHPYPASVRKNAFMFLDKLGVADAVNLNM